MKQTKHKYKKPFTESEFFSWRDSLLTPTGKTQYEKRRDFTDKIYDYITYRMREFEVVYIARLFPENIHNWKFYRGAFLESLQQLYLKHSINISLIVTDKETNNFKFKKEQEI